MKIGTVDLDRQVLVIAEIGNNHEGNFAVAQEMLGRAAEAGADAVKFQTFIPEHYVSSADPARLERLRRFQLSRDQFAQLARQAADLGVIFFSTPFDIDSAHFLNTVQPVFKIASGDNTFAPLIEAVAGFGKPLIVSTGCADLLLLERVRANVRAIWTRQAVDPGLAFLHCVASYPVPAAEANLGAVRTLREHFKDCTIGYSDHTLGVQAATYAVAAGARIVEKHFTLDKNYSDFRDHQLSADPADMRQLVDAIREVTILMGSGEKRPQPCEAASVTAIRRSIAAARALPAGRILASTDLTWVRPGTGIAPGNESQVLGGTLRRALAQGDLIQTDDLAPR
jgi:N,N'-diacetyllegionaminate synthase